ncbi:kelch-like protein 3 [Striga asiatica]|uniref:Kelch-like protein 3 n=1 Tax=Striga asiatica TaxID=4170 RepID=A0A5A7PFV4_STRAF|nr:kelch-like protein 3 [Striga asiatica]
MGLRKPAVHAVASHDLTICRLIFGKSVAFSRRRGRRMLRPRQIAIKISIFFNVIKESSNMANLLRNAFHRARTSTPFISFLYRNADVCFGVPFAGICCYLYIDNKDFGGHWERRKLEAKLDLKEKSEELSSLREKRAELEAGIDRLKVESRKGGETGMVGKESGRYEARGWFG